jgi:hypothetical protein
MSAANLTPQYPIRVLFADGDEWVLENEREAECTLEWFDSRDPDETAHVIDASGRRVTCELEGRCSPYASIRAVMVPENLLHPVPENLRLLGESVSRSIWISVVVTRYLLRLTTIGSLLAPDFVTEGRSAILLGKPGRGKTHLAIAIAYRALQNGFDALFTTAAELIDHLSAASREGKMRETLTEYVRPQVLVVDEVGYLAYGDDAANVLYHVATTATSGPIPAAGPPRCPPAKLILAS